jgi:hypothetical protein
MAPLAFAGIEIGETARFCDGDARFGSLRRKVDAFQLFGIIVENPAASSMNSSRFDLAAGIGPKEPPAHLRVMAEWAASNACCAEGVTLLFVHNKSSPRRSATTARADVH